MPEIIKDIYLAKEALDKGRLVAIPTETVYGLAGNALCKNAVSAIFTAKGRPAFNPLIVHVNSFDAVKDVATGIPAMAMELAETFWPGPLTLLLNKKARIPEETTGGLSTVAVRVPKHKLTLSLLQKLDYPLAAPSANPSGRTSPTCAMHVKNYFDTQFPYILDGGDCPRGVESTIIGFDNGVPVLYRHGAITAEAISSITGKLKFNEKGKSNEEPCAPGMLSRHYATEKSLLMSKDPISLAASLTPLKAGILFFKGKVRTTPEHFSRVLSATGDLEEACRNLYAHLHEIDSQDVDLIIAEQVPDTGLGATINDRLRRAMAKN